MKRKLFVILVIALLSVSVAMAGQHKMHSPKAPKAPRHNCGPEMGRHSQGAGKILRLADKLELSDKQIAQIKEKMEENGLDRIDRQAELKKAKLKLRHLKMNEVSDNKILSAIDKVGSLQTEMKKMKFIHRSEMKSILTETQQAKLKELRQEFRGECRSGGRGGPGHGFGFNYDDDTESVSETYGMNTAPGSGGDWEY